MTSLIKKSIDTLTESDNGLEITFVLSLDNIKLGTSRSEDESELAHECRKIFGSQMTEVDDSTDFHSLSDVRESLNGNGWFSSTGYYNDTDGPTICYSGTVDTNKISKFFKFLSNNKSKIKSFRSVIYGNMDYFGILGSTGNNESFNKVIKNMDSSYINDFKKQIQEFLRTGQWDNETISLIADDIFDSIENNFFGRVQKNNVNIDFVYDDAGLYGEYSGQAMIYSNSDVVGYQDILSAIKYVVEMANKNPRTSRMEQITYMFNSLGLLKDPLYRSIDLSLKYYLDEIDETTFKDSLKKIWNIKDNDKIKSPETPQLSQNKSLDSNNQSNDEDELEVVKRLSGQK